MDDEGTIKWKASVACHECGQEMTTKGWGTYKKAVHVLMTAQDKHARDFQHDQSVDDGFDIKVESYTD